ncbi:hypothetical protein C1645_881233 [Glomus cerebriforme]|uniref:F-box domain-containing protein n=1 Tax=Glomus cerebriforme TaxID=658196 RepID=A0A397SH59_9GLOM|nr:hypothetical protein C1645_881233 [Glomus cerebriforme]
MASKLPNEILLDIFTTLFREISFPELFQLRRTCKRWNDLIPIVISDELLQYYEDGWLFMFETINENEKNNQIKKKNKKSIESKKQIFFADFIGYDSRCQTFDFGFNDEYNALFEKKKLIKAWVTNFRNGIYFYIGSIKMLINNNNNNNYNNSNNNNNGKLQEDLCCFKGNNGEKSYGILGMEGTKDEFHIQYIKVKDVILLKALEDLMKIRKFDLRNYEINDAKNLVV